MTRAELNDFLKDEKIVLRAEVWDYIEEREEQNIRITHLLLDCQKNNDNWSEVNCYSQKKITELEEQNKRMHHFIMTNSMLCDKCCDEAKKIYIEGIDKEAKG